MYNLISYLNENDIEREIERKKEIHMVWLNWNKVISNKRALVWQAYIVFLQK